MNRPWRPFDRSFRRNSGTHAGHARAGASRGNITPVEVEILEERVVLSPGILAVGADAGSFPRVAVFNSENGVLNFEFNPYADFGGFTGGVRTAVGYIPDVNGNPFFPIVITAPGPGLNISAPVRIFSGYTGEFFTAYNPFPGFAGGIYLASADFDRDGYSEVVTGAGPGGGPNVKVFDLRRFQFTFDAFAYDANFTGGVRVATGKIDPNDDIPDLITAPGPGGGPHIKTFSGLNGIQFPGAPGSFFAYNLAFTGGVYLAAGDFNGDGLAEVVTGAGEGGGPHVRIINPLGANPSDPALDLNAGSTQFPFETTFTGGVRVAAAYIDGDNRADLIVARGPGAPSDIRVFANVSFAVIYEGEAFVNPRFFGGSFPSSGKYAAEALRIADDAVAPQTPNGAVITTADIELLATAAIERLEQFGLSADLLDPLRTLEFQVTDLAGGTLGLARPGVVVLDDDAAGFGWFVDFTPLDDEEFGSDNFAIDPDAIGKVDLFTVLLHEIGHQLGLEDLDASTNPQNLMTETLNPSERRLPDASVIEYLFSGDDLLDRLLAPRLF